MSVNGEDKTFKSTINQTGGKRNSGDAINGIMMGSLRSVSQKLTQLDLLVKKENESFQSMHRVQDRERDRLSGSGHGHHSDSVFRPDFIPGMAPDNGNGIDDESRFRPDVSPRPTRLSGQLDPPSRLGDNSSPHHRPSIGSDANRSLNLTNGQCPSPRPRPRALPIGADNGQDNPDSPIRRPQRQPKPLLYSSDPTAGLPDFRKKDNRTSLSSFDRNGFIVLNEKKYKFSMNDLQFIADVGFGSCGQVVEMKHKATNTTVAVKQMRRSGNEEEAKRIAMDLEVLLKCSSCIYIVQCYGYLITESEVWICMERMTTCFEKLLRRLNPHNDSKLKNESNRSEEPGKELEPPLKVVPQGVLGKIAVATVKSLNYLKENHDVIHRDVKPSNILINRKGEVKLCDFGISGKLVDSKARTRLGGCAIYLAPERIDPPEPSYDVRADIWSLGITLFELATGRNPFWDCKADFEVLSKVVTKDPPVLPDDNEDFELWPEFREFVASCLRKDFRQRPKYKDLLASEFIKRSERERVDVAEWLDSVYRTD
ncbi:dual specificity mitogen-activated protein kinase kinase 7-like isoform X1 [Brevipalpus obovatus]|uniref:dual specificity mitogen-activated protein kinase kinase 7-like isoform X1 n=1 Tax=Brevipalpus obovatus TaxID=246614 RepID=UPI003D9F2BE6